MNVKDFLRGGKQTELRRLGIWVMMPDELVVLLRQLYEWAK
jgi:hypothetical protein